MKLGSIVCIKYNKEPMIDSGLNVKKFKCKTNERKLCKLDVTSKFPLLKVSWVTCNKENLFISVDGGWGGWSQWSAQGSVTCGQGVRTRDRHCSNPPPAHGGAACVGDAFDSQACQQPDCPGKCLYSLGTVVNFWSIATWAHLSV